MPEPQVESLWTVHIVDGQPHSLFLNHRLINGGELEHFFEEKMGPTAVDLLDDKVQKAVVALCAEILARDSVKSASKSRRTYDHVNRVLGGEWAGGSHPAVTHVRWSRELEVPNGRAPGGTEDVAIVDLSDASKAAIQTLDDLARRRESVSLERARAKRAAW